MSAVQFIYHTGLARSIFKNPRLVGSWDGNGRSAVKWSEAPMTAGKGDEGCDVFTASIEFDDSQIGQTFRWGVILDGPGGANQWGIATEIKDASSADRYRDFTLRGGVQQQHYWFTQSRRLGSQKWFPAGADRSALRFAVWAPNAQQVDVVFAKFDPAGGSASGYIADDGTGIDASIGQNGTVPLQRGSDDIWTSDPGSELLKDWNAFFERPYMYRIKSEQGRIQYRTDLYSRSQIGRGDQNPHGGPFHGTYKDLDGVASCSMVVDPDLVTADFTDSGLNKQTLMSADEFWADEFNHAHMPPRTIEDLIIYELHVGSLNPATLDAGTFADAIALIPYLDDLGVNAVELMPVLQFDGDLQWGYGTSHYFCLQTSAGGGNQLKHFVKACHQRGIAVILDVVYNHFAQDADRAEWSYDTDGSLAPEHNSYYWYEGQLRDYRDWTGGYVNNGSSGWAPRYWEEQVRSMFVSSAAMLIDEYHIDGMRVDLTGAIHQDNSLNSDGRSLGNANQFGTKLRVNSPAR